MKTSCEIIKDLLPLYHDDVCSAQSRALVEEHVGECSECAKRLEDISEELDCHINAADDAKPIKAIQRIWEKDKRKSFIRGTVIAALVCAVLAGVFVLLTQWYILPVATDNLVISDVSQLSNGEVVFNIYRKDNRHIRNMEYTYTDTNDTVYITPKQPIISTEQRIVHNYDSYHRYRWLKWCLRDGTTTAYLGTPNDRVLLWQEGMELPAANEELEKMARDMFNNLLITNQSDTEIFSIEILTADSSIGVTAADFSPIPKGDTQEFHMDGGEACYFIVKIGSKVETGGKKKRDITIAQEAFTKAFTYNEGEQVHLYIKDDGAGRTYITDTDVSRVK